MHPRKGTTLLARTLAYLRQHFLALLALFVALGGTAYAIEANSVKSKHIVDGQVKQKDLGEEAVSGAKLDPALLSAIQSPSVRSEGTDHFETEVTQPNSCGSSVSTQYPAAAFDRLVFVSFEAVRTAETGTAQYQVHRPGGHIAFDLTGADSESGEQFFAVPAGETFPAGVAINDDTCTGSGGTLKADYRALVLEEAEAEASSHGPVKRRTITR